MATNTVTKKSAGKTERQLLLDSFRPEVIKPIARTVQVQQSKVSSFGLAESEYLVIGQTITRRENMETIVKKYAQRTAYGLSNDDALTNAQSRKLGIKKTALSVPVLRLWSTFLECDGDGYNASAMPVDVISMADIDKQHEENAAIYDKLRQAHERARLTGDKLLIASAKAELKACKV